MPLFDETQVRAILLDIEGTTTPINFVTKTLFPFASRKLEGFLRANAGDATVRELIKELRTQHALDERSGLKPSSWRDGSEEEQLRSSAAYGHWLIARDSKCTPLKALQGKIWQHGYASGELKGEVYPDVPAAFKRWKRQGKKIFIYSSGSVLAQQLLFGSVATGDLTGYISAFFDTRVGAKAEAESYRKIAAAVLQEPRQFLFVSDAVKEIDAAREAGMQALLCEREGRSNAVESSARVIQDFNGIFPE
ncbi:MAG TPA: acireductone synthase [Candidatus Acidoferrum sp.]|nr:acireductone synthase [Candidatus Acidoferrum sp.]